MEEKEEIPWYGFIGEDGSWIKYEAGGKAKTLGAM